jgi:hypothetical protein
MTDFVVIFDIWLKGPSYIEQVVENKKSLDV